MGIISKLKTILRNKKNKKLYVYIKIEDSEHIIDEILANSDIKEFWNEIRERFKRDIDEKELYKLFKFYIFTIIAKDALEKAAESIKMPNLLNSKLGYNLYRDKESFRGKLNKKQFRETLEKIWEYHKEMFFKSLF